MNARHLIIAVVGIVVSLTLTAGADPIAMWHLDETGGTTVVDAVAGNNGVCHGNVQLGMPGVSGSAAQFLANGYIEMAHSNAYLLDEGTVEFSFKDTGSIHHCGLFSKDSCGYDTGGHLSIYTTSSGKVEVRLQSTDASYVVASDSFIELDEWYKVTFAWGSEGMKLYIDNDLVDSDAYAGGLGTTSGGIGNYEPIVLGAGTWYSDDGEATPVTNLFSGLIDEVQIYNTAIPEPATLSLLTLASVALIGRRRRQGRARSKPA